jgi:hypothetical protein
MPPANTGRVVDIASLHRLAGDHGLERFAGDGRGRGQLIAGVEQLADEADDVSLVAHPAGGDGADGRRRQQAAGEVEDLALAVLGGFPLENDRARLAEPRRIAERRGPGNFRQKIDFLAGVVLTTEHAVEQTRQQRGGGWRAEGPRRPAAGQGMPAAMFRIV